MVFAILLPIFATANLNIVNISWITYGNILPIYRYILPNLRILLLNLPNRRYILDTTNNISSILPWGETNKSPRGVREVWGRCAGGVRQVCARCAVGVREVCKRCVGGVR